MSRPRPIRASAVALAPRRLILDALPGATVIAAAGDAPTRTIGGVAVRYGEVGRVLDGTRYRFDAGSLPDDPPHVPVLRDHDPTRPIGLVASARDVDGAKVIAAAIAAVRDGDEALILAGAGVVTGWSVGVNATAYTEETDAGGPFVAVQAAEWVELSLLTFPAFAGSRVANVAASAPEVTPPAPATEGGAAGAPSPAAPPPVVPLSAAAPSRRPLTLAGMAMIIAEGSRAGMQAAGITAALQAAEGDPTPGQQSSGVTVPLVDVKTADVAQIVQPYWRREILDVINTGTPLLNAITRRPLPPGGMSISYPVWTSVPTVDVQATQKTGIHTAPVTLGPKTDNVITWAGGNDVALQVVERSDPSFIDAYLRAAAVDCARKADTYVATTLVAAATDAGAPVAGDFPGSVAKLFGALNPSTTPGGALFLAVAYDVALTMIPITGMDGPALWNATIDLSGMAPTATAGGLRMVVDWNLPPGTWLLGSSQAAAFYGNPETPANVRVVDVSLLGLDIGVYFYGALAVEYPQAFAKLSGAPAALTASGRK